MTPTLRRARPQDAPQIAACMTRAYAQAAATIPDLPDVAGGIEADIADHMVWVVETPPDILGAMVLILHPDEAVLANIAVDPQLRGTGQAGRLIALAEQTCKDRDIRVLKLSTHAKMPGNLTLYEHLGWHVTGRTGQKIHMSKTLHP